MEELIRLQEEITYLSQFINKDRLSRIDEVLGSRTRQLTVVLEDIHKTHNANAVLRSCDGFGVQEISLRSPRLTSKKDIPFEEKFRIEGSVHYSMSPKLQIGASTMIIGPRTTIGSQQLDGFILVHSNLRYSFNEHLGAYIRLNNLLSQRYEWWQGFQEAPLHLFGGISDEF